MGGEVVSLPAEKKEKVEELKVVREAGADPVQKCWLRGKCVGRELQLDPEMCANRFDDGHPHREPVHSSSDSLDSAR